MSIIYRTFAILAFSSVSLLFYPPAPLAADAPLKVGMLIPGQIDDGGFMEAGYNGLLAIHDELGAEIVHVADVKPEEEAQIAASELLSEGQPDLILAHGGQNSAAAVAVSKKYPDIIFTMLNAGRSGATKAMRERGVKEIGNVVDWVAIDPEVFIGSAVANVSKAALVAARDFADGKWEPGKIVQIGLDDPLAVSLVLGADIPDGVQEEINSLSEAIIAGKIDVSVEFDGEEFDFPRQ